MAEQQQQLIWLGAGSATEPALNFAQYSKTLLVEAREEACTALSQRFAEATIQVLPTLVANEAATLPFTRYSLTEFSAVTPITGLKSLFPGIKVKTQEDINAVAVTKVVEQAALTGDHNTLVIDIPDQAFTLVQALINSKQLTAFSTLYIPYGTTALYAEMPPFSALTELLAKHYFALHHTATTDPDLPLYIFKQDAAAKTVAQLKQQLAQTKAKESELITQLAQATTKQAELTKQLEQAKQHAETYKQQASTDKQQAAEALAQATAKQAELTKQLEQAKQHAETYKQQASTDKEQAAEALAQATTKQAELTKQLEHANQHAETYTQQASTEKQQLAEALAQATAKQAELTKQQEQAKQHAANEKQLAETEKQQSSEALAQAIAKQAELAKQLEHAQQQATEALAQATAKQAELTKQLEQAKQQAAVEKQQATETLALAVTKEAEQTKQYDLVKKLNAEVTEKLVQLQKSSDLSIGELKTELANTQQQLSQALDSLKLAENTMQLEELLDKKLEKLIETQNQDLTKAVGNIKNHINAKVDNSAKQIEAFIGINNYLDKGIKPLNFHGWPISPDIGLYITGLIDANNYDVIIEFGSGTSTVLMAKALKAKQQNYTQPLLEKTSKNNSLAVSGASFNDLPSRIVTFEHNSQYYEKTLEALRNNQVDELVDLVHAPLVDYRYKDGSEYLYYHCADKMAELAKIFKGRKANILVLVDGPPGATNKNARFPALPHLLNHLPEHAFVIIMDDYSRSEEKDTVEQWKQIATAKVLNPQIEVIPSEKGLAILSINR